MLHHVTGLASKLGMKTQSQATIFSRRLPYTRLHLTEVVTFLLFNFESFLLLLFLSFTPLLNNLFSSYEAS